jgi:3-oxoacyl-[acyl-carrier-protein] synthase-1
MGSSAPRSDAPWIAPKVCWERVDEAVRGATRGLSLPEQRVDDVFCDINGERHRADEWGFLALRSPGVFRDSTAYSTAVGSWGDVGAAWGALGCVLAIQAWRRNYATGPRTLVCAGSQSGLRGAALLCVESA